MLSYCCFNSKCKQIYFRESGWIRSHDMVDVNVNIFESGGRFWQSPRSNLWNPNVLRGWPILYGTYAPQHLGNILGSFVPGYLLLPVLIVLIELFLTIGTFIFLNLFLKFNEKASLYGALLNLAIYYWYHEHTNITIVTLLPALVGFLSLHGSIFNRLLRSIGLLYIISVSNPPNTLIVMPFAHFLIVLSFGGKKKEEQLKRAIAFWALYCLYYFPTIVDYFINLPISNRADFSVSSGPTPSFISVFWGIATTPLILSPSFIVFTLMSKRNYKYFLIGLTVFLAIMFCYALNVILKHSIGKGIHFILHCIRYFIAFSIILRLLFF